MLSLGGGLLVEVGQSYVSPLLHLTQHCYLEYKPFFRRKSLRKFSLNDLRIDWAIFETLNKSSHATREEPAQPELQRAFFRKKRREGAILWKESCSEMLSACHAIRPHRPCRLAAHQPSPDFSNQHQQPRSCQCLSVDCVVDGAESAQQISKRARRAARGAPYF